jgi:hypothetical protein
MDTNGVLAPSVPAGPRRRPPPVRAALAMGLPFLFQLVACSTSFSAPAVRAPVIRSWLQTKGGLIFDEGDKLVRFRGIDVAMTARLASFQGWLDAAGMVVRFEHLLGFADGIAGRLFSSDSPTVRKGAVGHRRAHLDDELETLLWRSAGPATKACGYGEDTDDGRG